MWLESVDSVITTVVDAVQWSKCTTEKRGMIVFRIHAKRPLSQSHHIHRLVEVFFLELEGIFKALISIFM